MDLRVLFYLKKLLFDRAKRSLYLDVEPLEVFLRYLEIPNFFWTNGVFYLISLRLPNNFKRHCFIFQVNLISRKV